MKKNNIWMLGVIAVVVLFLATSNPSREAFMDKFQFRLTEDDLNRNFQIGDANFKMIEAPIYTCGDLPNNEWISYSSSDNRCWEQKIEFGSKDYVIPANEQFDLNPYLAVTWKPGFTVDVDPEGKTDFFRINGIFTFEFTDYDFLDIEITRKEFGVIGEDLSAEIKITNKMFGLDGKLVNHEKLDNLRFNVGTTVHTVHYNTDKAGEFEHSLKIILIVPSYEGEREITIPLVIEDSYSVLETAPEQNPIIQI